MFDKRIANVDGRTLELYWVQNDRDCYNRIIYDWDQHANMILGSVPRRSFVLQAGGNCGLYPLLYSNHFERVFTFEPDPMNFHCLAANCTSSKIVKFNTALGERGEFLTMGIVDPINVGMHRIGAGGVVIYSLPIDSLGLQHLALLHLDIEGFEYQALLGAKETIKRCRPTIVLEVTTMEQEIKQMLHELNYVVQARFSDPLNMLFLPKERVV